METIPKLGILCCASLAAGGASSTNVISFHCLEDCLLFYIPPYILQRQQILN